MRNLAISLSVLAIFGCTSVESQPGTEQIRLLSSTEAAQCKKLGQANAQVTDKIAFFERDEEKVAAELLTLARNEALKLGGNGLLAASEIRHGSRQYFVYLCPHS
ncbi:DUF4156 domain-containing protein [Bowmanella dokdonensis]|uniref:DUF4156 domain-containing protein n=1 Tax=Bowmanella dokdonensis TaxID=751969 RepID=A0A939INV2_9ALTE|nr:DUF4156 domain-containing protein [Bowmanella dokdonensis]MBN7826753.1 DUF4156 domain-containing protein [Bowmanella dokdonensis]